MLQVDYYLSLVSPWTFLGDEAFRKIAEENNASIRHIPVNLGAVFNKTGGLPLAKRSDARKALRIQELQRWRKYRGVDINLKPKFFPASDKLAAGMMIGAQKNGSNVGELAHAIMRAVWIEDRNIADIDTAIDIANSCGLNGQPLADNAHSQKIEQQWQANTEEAISNNVIGAPFYIIGEHTLWGQDRLMFVEEILKL